ncbi:alkaline phosphatase [Thiocapsa imhoffii]|uniref:Alkaline phosphatase n=1 Tax=Thiocapsa imhoffii TaxID=382777 RepID=A0A9X1B852_9GAMM|nr:alkaline phosphatase [Thiocapsa imhoffii]
MNETNQIEIEAATFRALVAHLQSRTDVQNIDLMNLAGFCRNCLAKWYLKAAGEQGHVLTEESARELIYGMPYAEWKTRYQREASAEQLQRFKDTESQHAFVSESVQRDSTTAS